MIYPELCFKPRLSDGRALGIGHRVVSLLSVVGLFLLTRDRQIPSGAPDMAIRREQSSRDGRLQPNNILQGDHRPPDDS